MAFTSETYGWLVFYPFGNWYLLFYLFWLNSYTFTSCARICNLFTLSVTWIASSTKDHHTLSQSHKASSLASSTFLWLSAWFWFITLTSWALTFTIISYSLSYEDSVLSEFHSQLNWNLSQFSHLFFMAHFVFVDLGLENQINLQKMFQIHPYRSCLPFLL